MRSPPWHIVTGEYPPSPGGVADYTRSVARGLALAGDEVHVWAPASMAALVEEPGVQLHPLDHGFGPRGIFALSSEFARQSRPRRLLLQYVAQAFGVRGMNVPFCAWIAGLRDTEVWVMFHEVLVRWDPWWRPQTAALAVATRAMAALLAARADRTFVSIPSWQPLLRTVAPCARPARWVPIPSNVPTDVPPGSRIRVRERRGLEMTAPVVGHFGTYGSLIAPHLKKAARSLFASEPSRRLLLLGRGSNEFARELVRTGLDAEGVIAVGEMDAADVATHLAACDVLLQPYPDGISTRRTSVMAGLALGVPIASNDGSLTEPIWRDFGAVELAAAAGQVAEAAERLLRDPRRAAAIGRRGRELYMDRFSLEHTVRALRSPEA